jgi:cytochrome P450
MERAGPPVDLCAEFAEPVALRTACELLHGIAPADRERFERMIRVYASPDTRADVLVAVSRELREFGRALIEQKRVRPGDDLLSELVISGELSGDELAGAANLMLRAAHHDMGRLLALGAFVLLADRERWETLQAQSAAMPRAVEELLRYCTVFHLSQRVALEDLELDGTLIEAGDRIVVSLAAANRDPEKFPDPDRLDLSRDASGQLALAHGRHICLGQHLVRLELQVGLEGLIGRFPGLHIAAPIDQIQMYGGNDPVYGVRALPVTW